MTFRTTVAIPLHASARWSGVVDANLERLAGRARVVVSDPTALDDTLTRLRAKWQGTKGFEWRNREAPPGWIGHCTMLRDEAQTEYFMWLPHDDDLDAAWVPMAEAVLDADPTAVLAIGRIEVDGLSARAGDIEIDERFSAADAQTRVAAALHILVGGDLASLGAAFRGVHRRAASGVLPDVDGSGTWADMLWAARMLAAGRFVQTSAVYRKRYHDANTHAAWTSLRDHPLLRADVLPWILEPLEKRVAVRLLGAAWDNEVEWLRAELSRARGEAHHG
jgi:hypothetical protein